VTLGGDASCRKTTTVVTYAREETRRSLRIHGSPCAASGFAASCGASAMPSQGSWARPRVSIPRTCGRSSAPITAASPRAGGREVRGRTLPFRETPKYSPHQYTRIHEEYYDACIRYNCPQVVSWAREWASGAGSGPTRLGRGAAEGAWRKAGPVPKDGNSLAKAGTARRRPVGSDADRIGERPEAGRAPGTCQPNGCLIAE
jgi:hypothetical protein